MAHPKVFSASYLSSTSPLNQNCLAILATHFESGELEESASLMLDWIHDMKKIDSIAKWS